MLTYFATFYTRQDEICKENQVWMLEHVSRYFDDDGISLLDNTVTGNEVLMVLKTFSKDKCLGPDGWPAEIFIHFFDLMGEVWTKVVEHVRIRGFMPTNLNSTFIALIPKKDEPQTFADFRPITLCNVL